MNSTSSKRFDALIAMNLLTLAVLTSAYGMTVISDINHMQVAITNSATRLVPMPEVMEFSTVDAALASMKGGK